jgi:hypothetical protein
MTCFPGEHAHSDRRNFRQVRAAADEDACDAAPAAWIEASRRCATLSRRRIGETHPSLALHAGEVLY